MPEQILHDVKRMSRVTGSFAAEAEASAGTPSELLGVIIALIAMTVARTPDQWCYG